MLHAKILEFSDRTIVSFIPEGGDVEPIDLYHFQVEKWTTSLASDSPLSEADFSLERSTLAGNLDILSRAASNSKIAIVAFPTADSPWVLWVLGAFSSCCSAPILAVHEKDKAIVFRSALPELPVGKRVYSRLFCLKCLESPTIRELRSDARYPYCKKHQDSSPHRRK